MIVCKNCKISKDESSFEGSRWGTYKKICKDCQNIENLNEKSLRKIEIDRFNPKKTKKCLCCGLDKKINQINEKEDSRNFLKISFSKNEFYLDRNKMRSKYDYYNLPYREICKNCIDLENLKIEINSNEKICSSCGFILNKSEFILDNTNKNGLRSDCKICHGKSKKAQYSFRPVMISASVDSISTKLRNQLNRVIKRKDVGFLKEDICHDGIDYTVSDFKSHIESLFYDGLSWENCHIDHFFPIHYLDSNKIKSYEDEIKVSKFINSLINLRPLPETSDHVNIGNLNRRYLNDSYEKVEIIRVYNDLLKKYTYLDKYIITDILQIIKRES